MIEVIDRVPTYPGRVKLTREDGTVEYVTIERADEPTVIGTPINKVLFDSIKEAIPTTPEDIGALASDGNAVSATKLVTSRTIRTNLASTSSASFNGTANIKPGVTGTLPISNGGTGNTIGAASALGSDTIKIVTTSVTTSEIPAGSYLSSQSVTATAVEGYTLLWPLNVQSNSSYTLVYALWKNETADKYGFSLRNLSDKAVTPTLSIRGLYVKTS